MIDWPSILENLRRAGVTQSYIAKHIGLTESAVGMLKRGLIKEPKYSAGARLLDLHAEICDSRGTESQISGIRK